MGRVEEAAAGRVGAAGGEVSSQSTIMRAIRCSARPHDRHAWLKTCHRANHQ